MITNFFQQLKSNWITSANLILLLGLITNQVRWQTTVDFNTDVFQEHIENNQQHPTLEKNMELFVPRKEAEVYWISIERTLKRIEDKVDKQ